MMACFECSQTFKMFYFHPCGGNQGWAERKHMKAIFHGTNWPASWSVRVCVSRHHKRQEDGLGDVHFLQEASGGRGNLSCCGHISFATETVSQKHFSETRGWPLHQSLSVCPTACVVLVDGCFWCCWGCTICCQTGRTAPELFAVVIVVN